VDSALGVLVAGHTASPDFPVPNGWDTSYNGSSGSYGDAFAAKLSAGGLLLWATYLGGGDSDYASGIAVDSALNVFVTGTTGSSDFSVFDGWDTSYNGSAEAFLAKFSGTGSLVWATYLGGSGADEGHGVAAGPMGSAYVTGSTRSSDFPVPNGWDTSDHGGTSDAFVSKFSSSGALVWGTYLGGSDQDNGFGIAVDDAGSAYVVGRTGSGDFPVPNGWDTSFNGVVSDTDAFVAKLSKDGLLVWGTYLGGAAWADMAYGVAADTAGSVFVAGTTGSSDFPMPNGWDTSWNGGDDAFVAKFSGEGALLWGTYVGGSSGDFGCGVAVDSAGGIFVTGYTYSSDFPVPKGWDTTFGYFIDAFVAKLSQTDVLAVQSAPVTGVSITGTKPGTTNYTVTELPDSSAVSLTAPTTFSVSGTNHILERWRLNGVDRPAGQAVLAFNIAQDSTAVAVYKIGRTLSVQSLPIAGVSITGTQPGTTDYAVECLDGSSVSLTAPLSTKIGDTTYRLQCWRLNGADQPAGQTTLALNIAQNSTAIAVYHVVRSLNVQSVPLTGVNITGTLAGTTNYSFQRDDNSQVTLGAPMTVAPGGTDYTFVRWIIAGAPQPDGQRAVVFNINTDTTAVAVYEIVHRTLTVQSTPLTGVMIGGTPGGPTNYTVQCDDNSAVNLTSPTVAHDASASYVFTNWLLNGTARAKDQSVLAFTINQDSTAVSEYAVSPLAISYPNEAGIVIQRGTACVVAWTSIAPLTKKTKLKVELVNAAGQKWLLGEKAKNSGSLKWATCKWKSKTQTRFPDGTDYRVRISLPTGELLDESKEAFAITTPVGNVPEVGLPVEGE
jgi:hypothetical protein